MTILMCAPEVSRLECVDLDEPFARVPGPLAPSVRQGLATRVLDAQCLLPRGLRLTVREGWRSPASQQAIIDRHRSQLRQHYPEASPAEIAVLASRFVAPVEVAGHVAGAAVDITLADRNGRELDLGTPIDATAEESGGDCYFDAPISPAARANRDLLAHVLTSVGLVNYPTEWWHWSYGDKYWALVTGADAAWYGPSQWGPL